MNENEECKIILVTGPPLNDRDNYILNAIDTTKSSGKIGYYHVFDYMKKIARNTFNIELTRANVLDVNANLLYRIRSQAFTEVKKDIIKEGKPFNIVSSPAKFRIRPSPTSPTGRINGFNLNDIIGLQPNMIIIFIDDLLNVRKRLESDEVWKARVDPTLKTLAEWRKESINLVYDIRYDIVSGKIENERFLDVIIFARGHNYETFIDLILGEKYRIYLSYHITGMDRKKIDEEIKDIKEQLKDKFICIDPYAIKDWDIINKYDEALENNNSSITLEGEKLSLQEVEEAIDEIRAQTVDRDYKLIESTSATVVIHLSDKPSYGVMSEIIYSRTEANNPVYVYYPHKRRPSPFFEYYANPENIIRGSNKDILIKSLLNKMLSDINQGKWFKRF